MSSDKSNFDRKVQLVNESLISTIHKFFKNPANYFFEEDIRSLMFCELRNNFENKISVPLLDDPWLKHYKEQGVVINPVKAEYGNDDEYFSYYDIKRIDIAVLSNQSVSDKGRNNYQRYCDIIIELKYSTKNFNSKHSEFISDFFEKIKKAKRIENHLGLAICFDLHRITDELKENEFIDSYKESNINFQEKKIEEIALSKNSSYAIYVTPNKVYIYGEKE